MSKVKVMFFQCDDVNTSGNRAPVGPGAMCRPLWDKEEGKVMLLHGPSVTVPLEGKSLHFINSKGTLEGTSHLV